jgi:hypothetical protein
MTAQQQEQLAKLISQVIGSTASAPTELHAELRRRLGVAVLGLQEVMGMLTDGEVVEGTAVVVAQPQVGQVIPAPASIEAAATAAAAPKKSKWGWLKKVLPVAGVVAGLALPGGTIIQKTVEAAMGSVPALQESVPAKTDDVASDGLQALIAAAAGAWWLNRKSEKAKE